MEKFNWLEQGRNFQYFFKLNEEKEAFLISNAIFFSKLNPIKYLGSGAFGDAWLLPDNKVLKIFADIDINYYKKILSDQFKGTSDLSMPYIYEYGNLKNNELKIGYAIMEYVKTPMGISENYINNYIKESKYINSNIKISDVIDEIDISKTDYKTLELYKKEKNLLIKDSYISYKAIIQAIIRWRLDEIFKIIRKAHKDFSMSNKLKEYIHNKITLEIKRSTLNKVQKILLLDDNWLDNLIDASIKSLNKGMTDIAHDNFGFRGDQVVFFDA